MDDPHGHANMIESPDGEWRAHHELGMEYVQSEQFEEAIVEFTQALVEAPEEYVPQCYASRGYAYFATDQFERAIDDCDHALADDANHGTSACPIFEQIEHGLVNLAAA